jgi:hypothetical protein
MKRCSVMFLPLAFLLTSHASAQFYGALSTTWNNPISASASMMIQGAINRQMLEQSIANQKANQRGSSIGGQSVSTTRTQNSPAVNLAVLHFKPSADSGVAKQIADVIGSDATDRATFLQMFRSIQRSYDTEAAKSGRSNNIAAALTFFLVANSVTYHQTDEPSDRVTESLFNVLEQELAANSEFKTMTGKQKQQTHDWLVVVGGFILAGYAEARKDNDAKELSDYKQLAGECFKLVVGTGPEKFNLAAIK